MCWCPLNVFSQVYLISPVVVGTAPPFGTVCTAVRQCTHCFSSSFLRPIVCKRLVVCGLSLLVGSLMARHFFQLRCLRQIERLAMNPYAYPLLSYCINTEIQSCCYIKTPRAEQQTFATQQHRDDGRIHSEPVFLSHLSFFKKRFRTFARRIRCSIIQRTR